MAYQDNNEFYYNNIKNRLNTFVETVRRDSGLNLLSLNVLAETFFAQFLNLLREWELENANRTEQNTKGIDLIDREHNIIAQVSSKTTHEKIQSSLNKSAQKYSGYHFRFIAIAKELPSYTAFTVPEGITFNQREDIFCVESMLTELLLDTRDAGIERKKALSELVDRYYKPETGLYELSKYLYETLERVREEHPSFRLMRPNELDEQLCPRAVERFEAEGTQEDDQTPRPVWERITESWQGAKNRSVVIEGDGGIGKTVTLLSPPAGLPVPAVYIRLYELVKDGKCLSVTDWLNNKMRGYAETLDRLAMQSWEEGPSLLLLLDGVNGIPDAQRSGVLGELVSWGEYHHGAQLILVSRPLDDWLSGKLSDPLRIKLKPLSEETVIAYLQKCGLDAPEGGVPEGSVLRLPLFLTLYAKTGSITQQREVEGYPLDFRDASGPGGIIWNYMQRELLRYERQPQTETVNWVLRCAAACEYILPEIAWDMLARHVFEIAEERVCELVERAEEDFDPERLPTHLETVWQHKRTKRKYPKLSAFGMVDFVLDDLGLLRRKPGRAETVYEFPHQNFRDCLAGLYLVNHAEAEAENTLPEVWKLTPNLLALDYAAELMDKPTAEKLWEANRKLQPTDHAATLSMLELQKRRKAERPALNFSGMDLRGLSLTRYCGQGGPNLDLFRDPAFSKGTTLDAACFRSQGNSDRVNCVAVTADGLCVSGSDDHTLRVWDLRSGDCLHTLKGHGNWVRCVAVTADDLCVSGADDGCLYIWNIHTGDRFAALQFEGVNVFGMDLSRAVLDDELTRAFPKNRRNVLP